MDDIFVDLKDAGLGTPSSPQGREDLAKQIGFSYAHLDRVMDGRNPYTGKLKAALKQMIVSKGSFTPEPVEQCEGDLPAVPVNPKPISPRDLYTIIPVADGYAVVQNLVAVFRGRSWAEEYVGWLNDQVKRGKDVS